MIDNYVINENPITIKRALISVFDKNGIEEFAKFLSEKNIEIVSTGGTSALLKKAQIPIVEINDFTNFPEIMGGRVKTINPLVEGGILALRDQHESDMMMNNINQIDLVVCNLYPFTTVIKNKDHTLSDALENIDIGGPTMIRSAAKNVGWVVVATHPNDYALIIQELNKEGEISYNTRISLAKKAFATTASYETAISNYITKDEYPSQMGLTLKKHSELRYGENPHQSASAYQISENNSNNILNAKQLQGKKLSYNNIMDGDAALSCLKEFTETACVIVKHANPCGVSTGESSLEAFNRAFAADSVSAFGGIIAMNSKCTNEIAKELDKIFVEIVIAPSFDSEALDIFAKKKNLRIMQIGDIKSMPIGYDIRNLEGGLLIQEMNHDRLTINELNIVTKKSPTNEQLQSMLFGWRVLKHVKSNAIITIKDKTTVGIGAGQVSRIDAVEIALIKSGRNIKNSILCSDAFFPFRDSIDRVSKSELGAIIQPGGSIKDLEVINACNEYEIPMVFTGRRCFKH